jgi:sulfite exporter TauE/SafE/copper chaperone CopZ
MKETSPEQELYVSGMHCAACETLLERTLRRDAKISSIKASLKDKLVRVVPKGEINKDDIDRMNDTLSEFGYTLSSEKPKDSKITESDLFKGFIIFTILLALFLSVERSGFFAHLDLNSSSNYFAYFLFGIAAGVSSCAALVGGLLLSLSKKWTDLYGGNSKKALVPFVKFNLGRLIAFFFLGALLGVVGSAFKISIITTSILTISVSALMIFMALQLLGLKHPKSIVLPKPKILDKYLNNEFDVAKTHVPFLVGALTFFLPCGFTLVAQTSALSSGSALKSGLSLLSFALGTLPALAVISFTSVKMYSNKSISKIFSFVAGLVILFFSIYTINAQLNLLGIFSLHDIYSMFVKKENTQESNLKPTSNNNVYVVKMIGKGFEYFPKTIELKTGVPTRIEFDNQGVTGCASVVSMRGLYDGFIKLNSGINKIEFTPTKPGNYKITCSMGMVPPVNVIVK